MAPRANWKGTLRIGEVACDVALHTAASTAERIRFHTVNRATGNRISRIYVDSETGKTVEHDDQVKGYELSAGDHLVLTPDEIGAAIPDSDKVLAVSAFLPCGKIDDVYFDKPYYLTPASKAAGEGFALIREGLRKARVAAIAQTVIFRRMRTFLIRAHDTGLVATALNFDYEVRAADEIFSEIAKVSIEDEMLDLAKHIIKTKMDRFDAAAFDDRYEAAVAELVRAKQAGRKLPKRPAVKETKVVDLLAALRESAKAAGARPRPRKAPTKPAKAPSRKAG